MAGVGIRVDGLDGVFAAIDQIADTTQIKQAVLEGALLVESTAITNIQHSPGGGRIYKRRGVSHEASLPGDPPKTDIGTLVSSIQHWVSDDGLSIAVGTSLEYGTYLEFGTKDMEPRPYLEPAVDVNRDTIVQNIKNAIEGSK